MPNYCHCVITITGCTKNMKKFYKKIKEGDNYYLTFKKTVPISKEAYEIDIMEANVKFWGTKWDLNIPSTHDVYVSNCYEILSCEENIYKIRCNTAWSPPISWAKTAADIFKVRIKIAYVESGMYFYGLFIKNFDKKYVRDILYQFLDDDYDWGDELFVVDQLDYVGGRLKKFVKKHELNQLGG